MKFSIITPTLQRESLVRCCQSVDRQTFTDWEQIVFIDSEITYLPIIRQIENSTRRIIIGDETHYNNGGNTPRHKAWKHATGDYVLYLDDDNYLADDDVLQRIEQTLRENEFPEVAFFPIIRHGCFFCPVGTPETCHVDTANLVVKREIGRWPDIPDYCSDGIFITKLVDEHPWVTFRNSFPIVNMPTSGFCQ